MSAVWLAKLARAIIGLALLTLLGAAMFRMAIAHNDFPLHYHPDEEGKVEQVRSITSLNFHHPLLLLETSYQLAQYHHLFADGNSPDDSDLVNCGRVASALFVTVGAVAMAFAAWRIAGLIGLLIAIATVGICPQLVVYGHYMKEDGGLACGVGLTFLGITLLWTSKHWWTRWPYAFFLGLAVAVAISGKAVGAAAIVPACIAVILAPAVDLRRWWLRLPDRLPRILFLATGLYLGLVTINHRAFDFTGPYPTLMSRAEAEFRFELDHAETGHSGVTMPKPNTYLLRTTQNLTERHIWLLLAAAILTGCAFVSLRFANAIWSLFQRKPRVAPVPVLTAEGSTETHAAAPLPYTRNRAPLRSRQTWLLMLVLATVPATFMVITAYNAIPFRRYALPNIVGVYFMAAVGAAVALHWIRKPLLRYLAGISLAGLMLFLTVPDTLDVVHQFYDDSREQVRLWIATLAPGTRVVCDGYAGLAYQSDRLRFPDHPRRAPPGVLVSTSYFAGDSGGPADLASSGVHYVILCETSYDRFVDPDCKANPDAGEGGFQTRHDNYMALLSLPAVWESKTRYQTQSYTSPYIRVVKVSDPPAPPTPVVPAALPAPAQ